MKKYVKIFFALIITLSLQSCATRLDFCECVDLESALMDPYMLSQKELEAKEKGCKWIKEELSEWEYLQRLAECWKENTTSQAENDEYSVYYPVTSTGDYDKSEVSFYYYPNVNGRPYAEFRFTDGTTFNLLPNCEGEYSWCIRTKENLEIGALQIESDTEGEAIFIDIIFNGNSSGYLHYLSKMIGTFRLFL